MQNTKYKNIKNLKNLKYTISVSYQLSKKNFEVLITNTLLERLNSFKDKIYDLNFTCRIPPFETDAMGANLSPMGNNVHFEQMIKIQETTGIQISADSCNTQMTPAHFFWYSRDF